MLIRTLDQMESLYNALTTAKTAYEVSGTITYCDVRQHCMFLCVNKIVADQYGPIILT
jgi:hypothetical protein